MATQELTVILLILALLLIGVAACAGDIPYGVGNWKADGLGNHRVRLSVDAKADAVWAHIEWRRRDASPEKLETIVVDAQTGKRVTNVVRAEIGRETGDIVFQPVTAPGEVFVYFMPYTESTVNWEYKTNYLPPVATADPAWVERNGLGPDHLAGTLKGLPQAKVLEIEARSEFDRFDPMEVIATTDETRALLAKHPGEPYLLFPEDRRYPIRMTDDLPLRWIESGPGPSFSGEAQRGEYYVFQIGVFAAGQAIPDLKLQFADLTPRQGKAIPASAFHCINLGGTDWLGRPITKTVSVAKGKVQALWIGFQVPEDAAAGKYAGSVIVRPEGLPERRLALDLTVQPEVIADHGDGDLWRMSRLRWLDSTIGLDDEVVAPYTPLKVDGKRISCLGRSVVLNYEALPDQITSSGRQVLAGPISLNISTGALDSLGSEEPVRTLLQKPGKVTFRSGGDSSLGFYRKITTTMEADGFMTVSVAFQAREAVDARDIALEIPIRRDVAKYMMGLGRRGGFRPPKWQWKWDPARGNNMVWVGDVDAGLYLKLKGPEDTWGIAETPEAWHNGGKGGCDVFEDGDRVVVRAYSGERKLKSGDELLFRFSLLITPVKPLDPAHWRQRYLHTYTTPPSLDEATKAGANIINIHQGNDLNPYINYVFRTTDKLSAYTRAAHERGDKVKIYYTVRELSNYTAEIWPLRSLGYEVYCDGPGHSGHSWLQEHLIDHYAAAWHQPYANGEVDAAIATQGLSRWHNYYLEGLGYMIRKVGIDGLYLDGIGYDREIMKRVRKVMDRARPGCLIDFHSGDNFAYADGRCSPAAQYMEHFPYINSLWFGEMYDYNSAPDYWLVEISGIPFGLYGEMLQDAGNPWRGMLYGMTNRLGWGGDPTHIWKLWDDFGIQDAKMIGYWSPQCPVRTDNPNVLATAYVKKGKTLISIASWAKEPSRVAVKIDWKALGLDRAKAHLYAPAIQSFQSAALFSPDSLIPVSPGRGWLLIADEAAHDVPAQVDAYRGRTPLWEETFAGDHLGDGWKTFVSGKPGNSLTVKDSSLAITALANCYAFAEHPLPAGVTLAQCTVATGDDHGATWGPGIALLWPNGGVRINVRSEGRYGCDAAGDFTFAGVTTPGSWIRLRIRVEKDRIVGEGSGDGVMWEEIKSIPRDRYPGDPVAVRIGKMGYGQGTEDYEVLGPSGSCKITEMRVYGAGK
jgi:hypothetical protein